MLTLKGKDPNSSLQHLGFHLIDLWGRIQKPFFLVNVPNFITETLALDIFAIKFEQNFQTTGFPEGNLVRAGEKIIV